MQDLEQLCRGRGCLSTVVESALLTVPVEPNSGQPTRLLHCITTSCLSRHLLRHQQVSLPLLLTPPVSLVLLRGFGPILVFSAQPPSQLLRSQWIVPLLPLARESHPIQAWPGRSAVRTPKSSGPLRSFLTGESSISVGNN